MARESLSSKMTRNAAWLYGQQIATNLISLAALAILSRQLDPAAFGLVALADVLLRFGMALGSSTVSHYVIYDRKEGHEERAQAAFWLNTALVGLMTLVMFLATPFLAQFYAEPLLKPVLAVILIRFFINQLCVVPDALVRRSLDFQKLVVRDTLLQLIASSLSVAMALTGWGVWSLILPGLAIGIPRFIIILWMSRWAPTLPLRSEYWGVIFSYTKHIMGSSFLALLTTDGDNLVVGKLIGSEGLGIYDRAWRTSNLITKNIVFVISDVAMPSLSTLSSQLEAFRKAYQRILRILSILSFPLLVGMFVLADDFILTLYGPKWVDAILPLRIFLVYTLQRSVGSPVGVVYNAMGRPDIGLKFNLALLPVYFASIFVGSPFGLVGIAVAVTVVKTISGLAAIYLASRLIGLSFSKVLRPLWPPLEMSLIMATCVYGLKIIVSRYVLLSAPSSLIIFTFTGGLILFLLLLTRYSALLDETLSVLDSLSPALSRRVRNVLHRDIKSQLVGERIPERPDA